MTGRARAWAGVVLALALLAATIAHAWWAGSSARERDLLLGIHPDHPATTRP